MYGSRSDPQPRESRDSFGTHMGTGPARYDKWKPPSLEFPKVSEGLSPSDVNKLIDEINVWFMLGGDSPPSNTMVYSILRSYIEPSIWVQLEYTINISNSLDENLNGLKDYLLRNSPVALQRAHVFRDKQHTPEITYLDLITNIYKEMRCTGFLEQTSNQIGIGFIISLCENAEI